MTTAMTALSRSHQACHTRLGILMIMLLGMLWSTTSHAEALCNDGKPIRFAGIVWESASFNTEVLRKILEVGYQCKTEEIPGNSATGQVALIQNDLQVWAEQWSGRADVIDRAVEAGKVRRIGDILPGGVRQGWYVPEYVIKGDPARNIAPMAPDLKSWRDLPRYKHLFADNEEPSKGRFLNCPVGWDCERIDTRLLNILGLNADYTNFRPGTGAAMDSAIASAYEQGRPILFYYWEPASLLAKYKFTQLELPEYNEACWKSLRKAEGVPGEICASGFLVSHLNIGVSAPFADANPQLIEMFSKITYSMEYLNQTIHEMTTQRIPGSVMADRFLREQPNVWQSWVSPVAAERLRAHLGTDDTSSGHSIFPSFSIAPYVNKQVQSLVERHGAFFRSISDGVLRWVLLPLENMLRSSPPWILLLAVGLLAWNATRRKWMALLCVLMLYLIGSVGLWDKLMQTLALVMVATLYSILVGIPIGLWMSRNTTVRKILLPVLDVMQTLPSFVYLVPVLMLFGLGKVPAIFATVIYAIPPVIRLTDIGIRHVDKETVEAARSFGTTRWQLLFGVQLPLARPSIMAGINQTTMMSLAMVVLASMIGARGLGEDVLAAIQTLDVGRGLQAGLAIVILAIVIDRISQAYGMPRRLRDKRNIGANAP